MRQLFREVVEHEVFNGKTSPSQRRSLGPAEQKAVPNFTKQVRTHTQQLYLEAMKKAFYGNLGKLS